MPQTFTVGARSLFVTLTAWVFMLLAVLASGWAVVQNASIDGLLQTLATPQPVASWAVAAMPWLLRGLLGLSLALLLAAIGLLLRIDGARRAFIVLLALVLVGNLLGLWVQQALLQGLAQQTLAQLPLPPQAAGVVDGFVIATRTMAVLISLGASALLLWIMRRLMSPAVRQEFA